MHRQSPYALPATVCRIRSSLTPVMIKLNPLLSGRLVLPETGPRDWHSATSNLSVRPETCHSRSQRKHPFERGGRTRTRKYGSTDSLRSADTQVHRPCKVEPTGLPIRGAISIGSQHRSTLRSSRMIAGSERLHGRHNVILIKLGPVQLKLRVIFGRVGDEAGSILCQAERQSSQWQTFQTPARPSFQQPCVSY